MKICPKSYSFFPCRFAYRDMAVKGSLIKPMLIDYDSDIGDYVMLLKFNSFYGILNLLSPEVLYLFKAYDYEDLLQRKLSSIFNV